MCAIGMMTSCSNEQAELPTPSIQGECGEMSLSFGSDTRATTTVSPEEANNFLITVSQTSVGDDGTDVTNVVRGPQAWGTMNKVFPVGSGYSVYAENCTKEDAESNNFNWGQKRFVGTSAEYEIKKGETTTVPVSMSVENASLCVIINPSLSNYFKESCTITLADEDRGLTWTYDNAGGMNDLGETTYGQIAYFNVDDATGTRTVTYTIKAVSTDKTIEKTGSVTLSRAKNSRLNLAYDSGFYGLELTIDEEDLYISEDHTLGAEDLIPDDCKTNGDLDNNEFVETEGGVDYDKYN